jgi:hypothetical protein
VRLVDTVGRARVEHAKNVTKTFLTYNKITTKRLIFFSRTLEKPGLAQKGDSLSLEEEALKNEKQNRNASKQIKL